MTAARAVDPGSAAGERAGIVTPEAVQLSFAEAGLGSRSLAFAIDLVIRGALLLVVVISLGLAGVVVSGTLAVVLAIAAVFGIVIVYPVVFEAFSNGRTPGKMAIGLRVVTIEGAPVRFRHAAIRSALGIVDFLASGGTAAMVATLATRHSQRLGDLVAGTIVVRERSASGDRSGAPRAVLFRPPPGWEAYTAALDVSALPTDVAVLVRAFLLRVHQLDREGRRVRARELAGRIAVVLGLELPAHTDPEAFLVAVAAAHQARHGADPSPAAGPSAAGATTAGPPPSRPLVDLDRPPDAWGT